VTKFNLFEATPWYTQLYLLYLFDKLQLIFFQGGT